MGIVEDDKLAINIRLLKLCRFHQMVDLNNTKKVFNRNIYQLICIVFTVFILCIIFVGFMGIFSNKDETLKDIDMTLLMFSNISSYLNMIKSSVLIYYANEVWDLFNVARFDFLKSKQCRKNINNLYDFRDWIIKITNYIAFLILVMCIEWILYPLIVNAFDDNVNCRKQNILNFRFPVSIHTYNQYYVIFYLIELVIALHGTYALIIIDLWIMSICWVITILYQILVMSFADVGYANKLQSEHYEDFKSILFDQIQLDIKLKSFYDVVRPIMLTYVGFTSSLIIILSYVLISVCSSLESYSAFEVLKLGSSTVFIYFNFFLFCYLFDRIKTTRDSVNFGMYSSNWMMMDLEFKKLLLLTMQINDANKIELRVSPNKIINLQLFGNAIKICYNVTSVMLKTMNNKQK